MGNSIDRGSHDSSSGLDGESIYDTLARDISYTKCSRSEIAKPNLRSCKSFGMESPIQRTRSTIRRTSSLKTTRNEKKGSTFHISELKVQVDGEVAILVPRNSALKRKRMSSVKSKSTFTAKPATQDEENEAQTSTPIECQLPSAVAKLREKKNPDLAMSRPVSLDSSRIKLTERNNNELDHKETRKEISKTRPKSLVKKTSSSDSSKNASNNNNNVNINRSGNMALNLEKARLKKLAATTETNRTAGREKGRLCKQASDDSCQRATIADLQKAKLRRMASAEYVFELNRRLGKLTIAPSSTESV